MTKKAKPEPVDDVVDDVDDFDEMVAQPAAAPAAVLCVNVDVNGLLDDGFTPTQVYAFLTNLKDLMR